jgi:hypothetical protein
MNPNSHQLTGTGVLLFLEQTYFMISYITWPTYDVANPMAVRCGLRGRSGMNRIIHPYPYPLRQPDGEHTRLGRVAQGEAEGVCHIPDKPLTMTEFAVGS